MTIPLKVTLITMLLETPDAIKPCKIIHGELGVELFLLVTVISRGRMFATEILHSSWLPG
jgi:hypothetical protein